MTPAALDDRVGLGAVLARPEVSARRAHAVAAMRASRASYAARPSAVEEMRQLVTDRVIERLDQILHGVWRTHRPWTLVADDLHRLADYCGEVPGRMLELVLAAEASGQSLEDAA